jgi:hypothetical protein
MNSIEKELPNAPDAERAIVGALIINPDLAHDTIPNLCVDDFYNSINKAILIGIREMLDAGDEIDPVLLAGNLRDKGTVHDPFSVINDLTYGLPHVLRLHPYIRRVKEKARARALIKKANEVGARIIDDGGDNLDEIAHWASATFDELVEQTSSPTTPLFTSFAEFMHRQFTDGETLAFNAGRGEVALIQSVTNRGKSTLIRNAALALATGGELPPVVVSGAPRKVLLLNFEGAGERFQRDLEVMTRDFTCSEIELVRANLFPVHAPSINDEPFTLSRHLPLLKAHARRLKPDVIIIDTAAAAFEIRNENDNAEIQAVMKALIGLARKIICLVCLIHHIGKAKMEEGKAREAAHRGRGASAWADFGTTIFNLQADADHHDGVILECAKRKDGENYERLLILNRETRWFTMSDEVCQRPPTNYELVVEAVKSVNRPMKRSEINDALFERVPKSTITRCIQEAVRKGDILKVGHGLYRFNENAHHLTLI